MTELTMMMVVVGRAMVTKRRTGFVQIKLGSQVLRSTKRDRMKQDQGLVLLQVSEAERLAFGTRNSAARRKENVEQETKNLRM